MDLAPLVIDPAEAKAKADEYRKLVTSERSAEDEAIAAAYRAAARGMPLFSLKAAFEAAGTFDDGLPRLAIVRADATQCYVRRQWGWGSGRSDDLWVFGEKEWPDNRGALVGRRTVQVFLPRRSGPQGRGMAHTTVPLVPPRHRPNKRRIRGFHILWEVERWEPVPSRDPALVRHLRGDLWTVVAVWDLTELEMTVLAQRARPT